MKFMGNKYERVTDTTETDRTEFMGSMYKRSHGYGLNQTGRNSWEGSVKGHTDMS